MAVIRCHYQPAGLGISTAMNIILPTKDTNVEKQDGGFQAYYGNLRKLPVLWLLHGGTDFYGDWLNKSHVELLAQKHGIAVVMPDAQNSSYIDMIHGPKWFTYFTKHLPDFIYSHFPISDKREDNFISGMSMGGYGAMNLALRCPDRYCAVAGIAAAVGIPKQYQNNTIRGDFDDAMRAIFGQDRNSVTGTEKDAYFNAEKLMQSGKQTPEILLLCGREDFTLQDNIEFRGYLEQLGYAPEWVAYTGVHDWNSWNHVLPIIMDWLPTKKEF